MDRDDTIKTILDRIEYDIEVQEEFIRTKRISMRYGPSDPSTHYAQAAIHKAENIIAGLRKAKSHVIEVAGAR